MSSRTIDYFIDSETDLARFEYYFEEELNIKSVTLKSIMFYVAYADLKKGILYQRTDIDWEMIETLVYPLEYQIEFSLNNLCLSLNYLEKDNHLKFHSDKNHLIIELLKNGAVILSDKFPRPDWVSFNKLFGFTETFQWRGKYRSLNPL